MTSKTALKTICFYEPTKGDENQIIPLTRKTLAFSWRDGLKTMLPELKAVRIIADALNTFDRFSAIAKIEAINDVFTACVAISCEHSSEAVTNEDILRINRDVLNRNNEGILSSKEKILKKLNYDTNPVTGITLATALIYESGFLELEKQAILNWFCALYFLMKFEYSLYNFCDKYISLALLDALVLKTRFRLFRDSETFIFNAYNKVHVDIIHPPRFYTEIENAVDNVLGSYKFFTHMNF